VKPIASPRVGANLEAILSESMVYVQRCEIICRCDSQTVMIDARFGNADAGEPLQSSKAVVFLALQAQTLRRHENEQVKFALLLHH